MVTHAIPVVPAERERATTWLPRILAALRAAFETASSRLSGWAHNPDADPASLQRILVELGRLHPDQATGRPNPATTRAVAVFQRGRDLRADGVADARTVHALARAWHAA
ncbi:peptidoglycan-binding domain-containing protein [Phytoactinopolyspora limicola]|uniref:peptidoglycan-binding domain-containing protein n=1 Tax=Phytoactinopolyspora limicola TaxID=2715536 RepID=UPI00140DA9F0|nr:peptidoglycan-binding domain-containing protein [Phytoactinopolyspora limicola]